RDFARLSFPQFVCEAINQAVKIRQSEMALSQFLPAVHPLLPKIRVAQQLGPPGAPKEGPGVPLARIIVSAIGGPQRAVEVPMRAENDLPLARLMEIGAENQRIHVAAEDLQHMIINRRVRVDV